MEETPIIPKDNEQALPSEEMLNTDPVETIMDAVPEDKKKEVAKAITMKNKKGSIDARPAKE